MWEVQSDWETAFLTRNKLLQEMPTYSISSLSFSSSLTKDFLCFSMSLSSFPSFVDPNFSRSVWTWKRQRWVAEARPLSCRHHSFDPMLTVLENLRTFCTSFWCTDQHHSDSSHKYSSVGQASLNETQSNNSVSKNPPFWWPWQYFFARKNVPSCISCCTWSPVLLTCT